MCDDIEVVRNLESDGIHRLVEDVGTRLLEQMIENLTTTTKQRVQLHGLLALGKSKRIQRK
jgi:hypothetical protein